MITGKGKLDDALDTVSVTASGPDQSGGDSTTRGSGTPHAPLIREAHDAGTHVALARDPHHEDAKLDVGLDESFPTSDPPAHTAPGHGDPAPSSGYDDEAERRLAEAKH